MKPHTQTRALLLAALLLSASSTRAQTGAVGIGTTNPQSQLHTTGAVRHDVLRGPGPRTVYADSLGRLITSPTPQTDAPVAILDLGAVCGSVTRSPLVVSGQPTSVVSTRIRVRVNITHPANSQILFTVGAPTGQSVMLTGNRSGSNYTNTVFADSAALGTAQGTAPYTGIFRPLGANLIGCVWDTLVDVASFAALGTGGTINPNGTWTLYVYDGVSGTTGTIDNWSISFDGSIPGAAFMPPNYVARGSASGGLTTGALYDDGTRVGIGTTAPIGRLQVVQPATTAGAALFSIANPASTQATVFANHEGTAGAAIQGVSSGGAQAGWFQNWSATSTASTLVAEHQGLGRAATFDVQNTLSSADALLAQTAGSGAAVRGVTYGLGVAAEFQNTNPASTSPVVRVVNGGAGGSVEAYSSGTGRAGLFQVNNTANPATALEAITYGAGIAAKFSSIYATGTANALEASTTGTGNAGAFFGPVYVRSNSVATGTYALQTFNSSNAPLAGVTNTGNLEVSGFTQHGTGAPAIKTKKITGTTASTQGGFVSIPHGLVAGSILSVQALVEYSSNNYVPPAYTVSPGYQFDYHITGTDIVVWNKTAASGIILTKPVKLFVTYEQ